jgi:hypothetical protein
VSNTGATGCICDALPRRAVPPPRLRGGLHGDATGAAIGGSGDAGQTTRPASAEAPAPYGAGMLLFQDGSTHRWIGTLGHDLDLIVTLDDATNWIYSAILVDEEGTLSSFLGLRETIAALGQFGALYTDRGSHSFITPKPGGKVDKGHLTQVGRPLSQLGIRHIPPYSPEGRGRMERMFGTLQQRLPPPLGRAGFQCAVREGRDGTCQCVRCPCGCVIGRHSVRPTRSTGWARQLRVVVRPVVADTGAAASPPLRQGDGPCA